VHLLRAECAPLHRWARPRRPATAPPPQSRLRPRTAGHPSPTIAHCVRIPGQHSYRARVFVLVVVFAQAAVAHCRAAVMRSAVVAVSM
jgi:hypothetical protein